MTFSRIFVLKANGTVPSRREPSSNDTGRLSGALLSRETQSYTDGSGTLLLISRLSQRFNPRHADYTLMCITSGLPTKRE